MRGVPAYIVVPWGAPRIKLAAIQTYGAHTLAQPRVLATPQPVLAWAARVSVCKCLVAEPKPSYHIHVPLDRPVDVYGSRGIGSSLRVSRVGVVVGGGAR